MVDCASCGRENREGRKFCVECGRPLAARAARAPSCGAPYEPGERFCGECGTALTAAAPRSGHAESSRRSSERRLVSVLFADLVGFTSLSEKRDAEEVRDLQSRYLGVVGSGWGGR